MLYSIVSSGKGVVLLRSASALRPYSLKDVRVFGRRELKDYGVGSSKELFRLLADLKVFDPELAARFMIPLGRHG